MKKVKSNTKSITILYPYRAFHNQDFNVKVLLFFFAPPIFNLLVLFSLNFITTQWANLFNFFLNHLGYDGVVLYIPYHIFHVYFLLPYIDLPSDAPNAMQWWGTLISSLVITFFTYFISDSFTPLKYIVRAFLFVVSTALFYFWFWPSSFPYDIAQYTRDGLLQILALMFATPWIFGFTYYLFGYHVFKKMFITLVTLLFLAVAGAFQYLLSAYFLSLSTLLFMPALYIFFGCLIDIFSIIAFYAFGVSLEQVFSPKQKFPIRERE